MSRRYGDSVANSFGLDKAPLLATRSLQVQQIAATHVVCGAKQIGMTPRIPREDTFIAAISLTDMPLHELWSKGRPFISEGWGANSMRIVNLTDEFAARVFHPHEAVSFYIPRASLDEVTDEAGDHRVANLSCPPGIVDPTMAQLAAALLPAFARPHEASEIFVDHVLLAVCAHLIQRYGGGVLPPAAITKGGLTPVQTLRAKDLLASRLKGDLRLAEVAKECGISRQHFIKAFKTTVGCTPYQWLQRQRVDLAKDMLGNTRMPISTIAIRCGFADQSHLTRVFAALVGVPPGAWRRQYSRV
jgi:AraC family transcriptional regulator